MKTKWVVTITITILLIMISSVALAFPGSTDALEYWEVIGYGAKMSGSETFIWKDLEVGGYEIKSRCIQPGIPTPHIGKVCIFKDNYDWLDCVGAQDSTLVAVLKTPTPAKTSTPTTVPTSTNTPLPTNTPTLTSTPTVTLTPTPSPTSTLCPTATPTVGPTATPWYVCEGKEIGCTYYIFIPFMKK